MSAWLYIALIVVVLFLALLFVARLPRRTWELTAAALILGLTGYAWQGNPHLVGAPAKASPIEQETPAALLELRAEMTPTFDISRQWTGTSDALARSGKYDYAMAYVQSGLKKYPENPNLWSALGLYAVLASDGQLTDPAKFAFSRARNFDESHPAPDYFEGLTALFEGRPAETVEKWQRAIGNARKNSKWAPKIQGQLDSLLAAANQDRQRTK
jgi:cytochrome c-type biogenesis protein CcmH